MVSSGDQVPPLPPPPVGPPSERLCQPAMVHLLLCYEPLEGLGQRVVISVHLKYKNYIDSLCVHKIFTLKKVDKVGLAVAQSYSIP